MSSRSGGMLVVPHEGHRLECGQHVVGMNQKFAPLHQPTIPLAPVDSRDLTESTGLAEAMPARGGC